MGVNDEWFYRFHSQKDAIRIVRLLFQYEDMFCTGTVQRREKIKLDS